jgi:hypothetical protein
MQKMKFVTDNKRVYGADKNTQYSIALCKYYGTNLTLKNFMIIICLADNC